MDIIFGEFEFHAEKTVAILLVAAPLLLAIQAPRIIRGIRILVYLIKRKPANRNDIIQRVRRVEKEIHE